MDNKEHGDYVVDRHNQIVLFSGRGPWNDETLKRGSRDMAEQISRLDMTKPWGQISCLYGESLMPPSTFGFFVKQSIKRKALGLTALAIVILDSDIANTIKRHLSEAYDTAGIDYAFFDSIDAASSWLQQQGLEVDCARLLRILQSHNLGNLAK